MICNRCQKIIPRGSIRVDTYRIRVGQHTKNNIDLYCVKCFSQLKQEKAWNVYRQEKINSKKTNTK